MKVFCNNLSITLFFFLFLSGKAFCQLSDNVLNNIINNEKRIYISKQKKYSKSVGNNYDLKYHRFDWFIDPDTLYIKGSVKSIFLVTKNHVSEITFELNSSLTVDSVINNNSKLGFNHTSDDILKINLSLQPDSNSLDSVTIYYHGVPLVNGGFGSFMKTYHDTLPQIPQIWTLSEPYGSKDWWPCKSSLNDKIDSIDIIVTSPAQYKVASNGLMLSETIIDNQKVTHWKHKYPIAAYLIAIAVTNFTVYKHYAELPNGKKLEIVNYIFPEDTARVKHSTKMSVPYINLFNKIFITYPFADEQYGHAEFGWQGGMEHQTMTFLGQYSFQLEIVSHELAHQWFGDMVTCGRWGDLWLNEGFATYATGLCYQYLEPYYWKPWKKLKLDRITKFPNGSVYVKDTFNIDTLFSSRLTYNKGAMVLHMIRWIIGDSNFFRAVRNYLLDPRLSYSYAVNADLKYHFEKESKMDLTEFFDEWYYGQGYPSYNINIVQDSKNNLLLTFNQTQSDPSVDFFKMPIPIQFKGKNKDTTIIFNNTINGQSFNAKLSFHADTAIFDPEIWLIAHSDISIVNSVGDMNPGKNISVYPNPASSSLFINTLDITLNKIELIEPSGRTIKSCNFSDLTLNKSYIVDVANFKPGIYFLKVYTEKGIAVKKLTKI